MGHYLRVDLAELKETAGSLSELCADFNASGQQASGAAQDVGSDDIARALTTFASNWDFHKKQLVDQLEGLRDMADHGHATYIGVDEDLARQATDALTLPVSE